MPQPLTVQHAGNHGGLQMRLIERARQHQHPSNTAPERDARRMKPAGTAGEGFLLAGSQINQTSERSHWMRRHTVCDSTRKQQRHEAEIKLNTNITG